MTGVQTCALPISTADAARWQVDELVERNPEHAEMVSNLEHALDASEGNPLGVDEVPTGDELAAELERFLSGEDS